MLHAAQIILPNILTAFMSTFWSCGCCWVDAVLDDCCMVAITTPPPPPGPQQGRATGKQLARKLSKHNSRQDAESSSSHISEPAILVTMSKLAPRRLVKLY